MALTFGQGSSALGTSVPSGNEGTNMQQLASAQAVQPMGATYTIHSSCDNPTPQVAPQICSVCGYPPPPYRNGPGRHVTCKQCGYVECLQEPHMVGNTLAPVYQGSSLPSTNVPEPIFQPIAHSTAIAKPTLPAQQDGRGFEMSSLPPIGVPRGQSEPPEPCLRCCFQPNAATRNVMQGPPPQSDPYRWNPELCQRCCGAREPDPAVLKDRTVVSDLPPITPVPYPLETATLGGNVVVGGGERGQGAEAMEFFLIEETTGKAERWNLSPAAKYSFTRAQGASVSPAQEKRAVGPVQQRRLNLTAPARSAGFGQAPGAAGMQLPRRPKAPGPQLLQQAEASRAPEELDNYTQYTSNELSSQWESSMPSDSGSKYDPRGFATLEQTTLGTDHLQDSTLEDMSRSQSQLPPDSLESAQTAESPVSPISQLRAALQGPLPELSRDFHSESAETQEELRQRLAALVRRREELMRDYLLAQADAAGKSQSAEPTGAAIPRQQLPEPPPMSVLVIQNPPAAKGKTSTEASPQTGRPSRLSQIRRALSPSARKKDTSGPETPQEESPTRWHQLEEGSESHTSGPETSQEASPTRWYQLEDGSESGSPQSGSPARSHRTYEDSAATDSIDPRDYDLSGNMTAEISRLLRDARPQDYSEVTDSIDPNDYDLSGNMTAEISRLLRDARPQDYSVASDSIDPGDYDLSGNMTAEISRLLGDARNIYGDLDTTGTTGGGTSGYEGGSSGYDGGTSDYGSGRLSDDLKNIYGDLDTSGTTGGGTSGYEGGSSGGTSDYGAGRLSDDLIIRSPADMQGLTFRARTPQEASPTQWHQLSYAGESLPVSPQSGRYTGSPQQLQRSQDDSALTDSLNINDSELSGDRAATFRKLARDVLADTPPAARLNKSGPRTPQDTSLSETVSTQSGRHTGSPARFDRSQEVSESTDSIDVSDYDLSGANRSAELRRLVRDVLYEGAALAEQQRLSETGESLSVSTQSGRQIGSPARPHSAQSSPAAQRIMSPPKSPQVASPTQRQRLLETSRSPAVSPQSDRYRGSPARLHSPQSSPAAQRIMSPPKSPQVASPIQRQRVLERSGSPTVSPQSDRYTGSPARLNSPQSSPAAQRILSPPKSPQVTSPIQRQRLLETQGSPTVSPQSDRQTGSPAQLNRTRENVQTSDFMKFSSDDSAEQSGLQRAQSPPAAQGITSPPRTPQAISPAQRQRLLETQRGQNSGSPERLQRNREDFQTSDFMTFSSDDSGEQRRLERTQSPAAAELLTSTPKTPQASPTQRQRLLETSRSPTVSPQSGRLTGSPARLQRIQEDTELSDMMQFSSDDPSEPNRSRRNEEGLDSTGINKSVTFDSSGAESPRLRRLIREIMSEEELVTNDGDISDSTANTSPRLKRQLRNIMTDEGFAESGASIGGTPGSTRITPSRIRRLVYDIVAEEGFSTSGTSDGGPSTSAGNTSSAPRSLTTREEMDSDEDDYSAGRGSRGTPKLNRSI